MLVYCRSALTAALFIAAGVAQACGTGELLLADEFDTMTKTWGRSDEFMKVRDGKLVISERDGDFYVVYAGPVFNDVDYCATVTLTESSDPSGSYGGLTFWAKSVDDFYTFQITLDGYATVYRYTGQWESLVKDRPVSAVRQGIGAENELRVVTEGGRATFYINGEVFDSVTGTPPAGGHHVGFTIEAPQQGNATFALDDVSINSVSGQN